MEDKIKQEIKKLETEITNSKKALEVVKEQIKIYDLKGKEITAHLNYTKGALDILKDLIEPEEGEEENV
jgi:septal ring factor EnvC (AmiA/AmiB activator)